MPLRGRLPVHRVSDDSAKPAYLILRREGRWTDVFRLLPGHRVLIGRSSQSQIVIRSDQCSRAHAELASDSRGWIVRDLSSRNGTLVDGQKISQPHRLRAGESISIAGYSMTFVHSVGEAFAGEATTTRDAAEADSRTLDAIDPTVITDRRRRTSYLDVGADAASLPLGNHLFRIAFSLAQSESPEHAAETALAALSDAAGVASGAVLVLPTDAAGRRSDRPSPTGMTVLAARSRPERSYRRLSDKIAAAVIDSGEAVLARNIVDDLALADPDSRGQWSTTSALGAPILIGKRVVGILHAYSTEGEPELSADHLELALAIAANLGLALEHHWNQRQLAHHLRRSQAEVAQLRARLGDSVRMIGQSPPVREVEQMIARAAPTGATVLIRGESGVGKELIAAAIHHASPRRDGPFVCLNCAALSPSLLESELFGHEKGAFTGATERKIGKFEAADGGTLMLDEIGEMDPDIQAKFLRVLEGHAFERVGGNTPIKSDVRVVAATNRDLETAVQEGRFRSDLFFRLHVLEVRVPPLRHRGHDVLLLATHFLDRFSREMGRRLEGFTPEARKKLLTYSWPGNVRELKNTIERAVVLGAGPMIDASEIWLSELRLPGATPPQGDSPQPLEGNPCTLAEMEQRHIESVLRYTNGNKSQAARILGIERSTLDRKLKRLER